MLPRSHHCHKHGQAKKYSRGIFGDLGQDIARPRAKQGVGRRPAKSHPGPGFLLRQLQQHQKDQNDTIHKHEEGQQDVKYAHNFPLNRVLDNIRKTACVQ